MSTHIGESLPRFAVILPHPEQSETCAIDMNTGTLPGVQFDLNGSTTREEYVLQLARRINNHGDHSVDYSVTLESRTSLYWLQKPNHDRLAPNYGWLPYGEQAVRSAFQRTNVDPAIEVPEDYRTATILKAQKSGLVLMVARSLRLGNHREAIKSFFEREQGMHALPLASELLR